MKIRRALPDTVFALFDAKGELFSVWPTQEEADADAIGPRFRPSFSIVEYRKHGKAKTLRYGVPRKAAL